MAQIDRQAEDRAHRIGQLRPVTVHRFVTKDSVDESIHMLSQRKLRLDAVVLGSGDAQARPHPAARACPGFSPAPTHHA